MNCGKGRGGGRVLRDPTSGRKDGMEEGPEKPGVLGGED